MKVLSPNSLGTGVFWDLWFKFQLQNPIEFHWTPMQLQRTRVWVLMSIPFSRPQDSRQGETYCRYHENEESSSFPSIKSPETRLDFRGSSRTLSQDNLPRHLSKCLDPVDLFLWTWRILVIIHVKWWLAQKLEARESFSPSIWRPSFRIGVMLAPEPK